MFRLIPLHTLVKGQKHKISAVFPIELVSKNLISIRRETIAPNSVSPANELGLSWTMTPDRSNTLLMTSGRLELSIYCAENNIEDNFVLTPDKIYRNGQFHYGNAAMLKLSPGVFYNLRTNGVECTFMTFISYPEQNEHFTSQMEKVPSEEDTTIDQTIALMG